MKLAKNLRYGDPSAILITEQEVPAIASDEFKPLINREYKLEDIQQAYEYVETGQKVGNVIIKL